MYAAAMRLDRSSPISRPGALALLMLLAAILRLVAARNDLWLDELMSLDIAQKSASVLDIFTSARVDNNHFLNTVALHFLPRTASPLLVRMPALLWSLASVAAAWWALGNAPEHDAVPTHAITRTLFTAFIAFSYPLVHFGSEARGYSGALFAAILLYGAYTRWTRNPAWRWTLLSWLAVALGVLSHLGFLLIWFPLALPTLLASRATKQCAMRLMLLHLPPLLLAAFFWWTCLRGMVILGGPHISPFSAILRYDLCVLALPIAGAWLLLPVAALLLASMILVRRHRTSITHFPLLLLIFFPPGLLLALRPEFIASRYLLGTAPFLLLLLASLAAAALSAPRPSWLRPLTLLAITLFLASNITSLLRFLHVGRSDFRGLTRTLVAHSSSSTITLSPDFDFRWSREIDYANHLLPPGYALAPPVSGPPRFFLVHGEPLDPPGDAEFTSDDGFHFSRIAYFPCSDLSGQAFTLYQRTDASSPPVTLPLPAIPVR